MKERPILYTAAMVRALLRPVNPKSQTRRLAKGVAAVHTGTGEALSSLDSAGPRIICPYGQPGDRLWVRENGWERPERTPSMMRAGADTWAPYYYDADGLAEQDSADLKAWGFKRRPSIHMPRWASRITLEITGVRIERLQDITAADAISEGIEAQRSAFATAWRCYTSSHPGGSWYPEGKDTAPILSYRSLWESLHGGGSWAANPLVWVMEFKKL